MQLQTFNRGSAFLALTLTAGLAAFCPATPPVAAQTTPASASVTAPDPFYSGLMRDGRTALLRGDAAGAASYLRLACFGFLDFPATLAECRIRLGLAQAALGDRDAFLESFSRLEDLEERFQVYAAAGVSAEERAAFEQRALDWVAPEVLRTIPAFAPILERKKVADFAKLAPRERTKELERRAAADPEDSQWSLLLAEEELARDKPEAALDRLGKHADSAGDGAVGCLRGRALAELERCGEAVKSLSGCAKTSSEPRLAELLLACYLDLDKATEARAFAASLPPAVATRPEIRKRIGKIPAPANPATKPDAAASASPPAERGKPAATARKPVATETEPAAEKPVAGTAKTRGATPPARPTSADQSAIADIRKAVRSAEKRDELESALARALPIADRYPGEAELQLLVGELGYRTGNWKTGAAYLSRPDRRGPSDATLRFYLAVCQFESGETTAAARTASTGLEKLPRTPLVEGYLKKILPAK
jgi:tetratricopeptide (TPR) repeat protein